MTSPLSPGISARVSSLIHQEKSDAELSAIGCQIIDLLHDSGCNLVERYKILSVLKDGFAEDLKQMGGQVTEKDLDKSGGAA